MLTMNTAETPRTVAVVLAVLWLCLSISHCMQLNKKDHVHVKLIAGTI
jgi:hypothetical protein